MLSQYTGHFFWRYHVISDLWGMNREKECGSIYHSIVLLPSFRLCGRMSICLTMKRTVNVKNSWMRLTWTMSFSCQKTQLAQGRASALQQIVLRTGSQGSTIMNAAFGPDWNISTTTGWIAMTFFCTHIHDPQRVNPHGFDGPLTLPLVLSSGHNLNLSNTFIYDQIPTKILTFTSHSVRCV